MKLLLEYSWAQVASAVQTEGLLWRENLSRGTTCTAAAQLDHDPKVPLCPLYQSGGLQVQGLAPSALEEGDGQDAEDVGPKSAAATPRERPRVKFSEINERRE